MIPEAELEETRATIHVTQACLRDQQAKSNHVIMQLKLQLHESRLALRQQRVKADRQLGEVMAQLLFLEGRLRKQKARVRTDLAEKDRIIENQKQEIKKLTGQNNQLLNAIKELCARGGINGLMRDSGSKNGTSSNRDKGHQGHRGRLGSMKDKFWKNRSSLELNSSDLDQAFQAESLLNGRQYSSHEDLHSQSQESKKLERESRDSLHKTSSGHMTNGKDSGISSPSDSLCLNGSSSSSDDAGDSESGMFLFSSSHINSVIKEEDSIGPIMSNYGGLGSMGSMPMLAAPSSVDPGLMTYSAKTRPHSLSSVDLMSIQQQAEALSNASMSNSPTPPPSPSYTAPGKQESTPFKTFKTMFRRKGGSKNKKRSVSLSQNTTEEYSAAMRKHFQKYDMS